MFDAARELVEQVAVQRQVFARQRYLLVNRPISLLNSTDNLTVTLQTNTVVLLLSGNLPNLRQIETNPEFVQVTLDVSDIPRHVATNIMPNALLGVPKEVEM